MEKGYTHSYHLYPILIEFKKLNIDKKIFFKKMNEEDINLQVHYIPVYHQEFLKRYKFNKKDFPVTEEYFSKAVSLPIYFSLTENKIRYVIKQMEKILNVK